MALCHPRLGAARAGAGSVSRLGSPSSHSGLVPSSRAGQGRAGRLWAPPFTHLCVCLAEQGEPGALVLQECPVLIPRGAAGPARLMLCADICAHTHTEGWPGTNITASNDSI